MKIKSAQFVLGVKGSSLNLEDGIPQIAFIGRSNVGKSSLINALTNQKELAISSSFPGRTQEINLFLINETVYFVDLPGYGFAKGSLKAREKMQRMINWYLFESSNKQKVVVLIIDAEIGPTEADLELLSALVEYKKPILIVANKVDKIKSSQYVKKIRNIHEKIGQHPVILFSAKKKMGVEELLEALSLPA